MYDLPGLCGGWAVLWRHLARALRAAGQDAPASLLRPHDLHHHWRDRRVLVSQTCAPVIRDGLWRHVAVLGAFDFGLDGCPPGTYRSVLVCRAGEGWTCPSLLVRGRAVVNGTDSQSGHGCLVALGARLDGMLVSGAHVRSIAAVRRGQADFAAIDAMTWRALTRWPGATAGLEVAGRTPPTPAMPLITARSRDVATIRAAIHAGLAATPVPVLRRIGVRGFVPMPEEIYRR